MADFDPDERFNLPDDTDPDEVLRRLLESDGADEAGNTEETDRARTD